MLASAALATAKRLVNEGKVAFTSHAVKRMKERSVTVEMAKAAVLTASRADVADGANWKLAGTNGVVVVVALSDDCLFITVWTV